MIVIVDDHQDTGLLLAKLLKREGFPTNFFDSGHAALAAIEALNPSLLVLDQMMPDMLGTDVLRAIRKIPALADVPVIFYSGAASGRDEARQLGAKAWLTKGQTPWGDVISTVHTFYDGGNSANG